MPEAEELAVCPYALEDLREILCDTDPDAYTYEDARLEQALRDNRRVYLFRDPGFASSGVNPFLWYRGKVHVPPTNPDDTLLQAEPGLRCFQAARHVRHWDSEAAVDVWQNGVKKTAETDYALNHREGRVTFTYDVHDWETVNASFACYRIYHAARDVLAGDLGRRREVSIKLSDNSYTFAPIKDALYALDRLIGNMTPQTVRSGKKLY